MVNPPLNIVVTGANGFLGSFICEEFINKGHIVYAFVRSGSSLKNIQDIPVNIINPIYNDSKTLSESLLKISPDLIIHAAGVTSATKKDDFYNVNFGYTKNLIDAVNKTKLDNLKKIIFISSLAAQGPGPDEDLTTAITATNKPKPVCNYGKSKLLAENYIISNSSAPYIILRPTAVYGPRDTDCIQCFKLIQNGIEIHLGFKESFTSFIYVKDLAKIIALLSHNATLNNKTYIVSDNKSYSHTDFLNTIKTTLHKNTVKIRCPLTIVFLIATFGTIIGNLFNRRILLNREKYFILRERNWQAIDLALTKDLNFCEFHSLADGVLETAKWLNKK